jgi:hypothetical protein
VQEQGALNFGFEATGYLRFIVENYDSLPRFMIFCHGDPANHSPGIYALLQCLNPRWEGFVSLVDRFFGDRVVNERQEGFLSDINEALAAEGASAGLVLPLLGDGQPLNFYCCAQFVLTSGAARRFPLRFYEILLAHVENPRYFAGQPYSASGKLAASVIEHLWHVIFGEQLRMDAHSLCSLSDGDAGPYLRSTCPQLCRRLL